MNSKNIPIDKNILPSFMCQKLTFLHPKLVDKLKAPPADRSYKMSIDQICCNSKTDALYMNNKKINILVY